MKNSILKEQIVIKKTIGKILIESVILSAIIVLLLLTIIKLMGAELLIRLMWQLINNPGCIILPLFPVLLSIIVFIKIVEASINEKR